MSAAPPLLARLQRIEEHYAALAAFAVSLEGREAFADGTSRDFTYGETPASTMVEILEEAGASVGTRVYDLGAGAGRATLAAALVTGHAVGVERVGPLVRLAEEAREALRIEGARFVIGDLREADLSQADLIYAYSTCFTVDLMHALARASARTRPGTSIVVVTQSLHHRELVLETTRELPWTSGDSGVSLLTVRRYRRR